MTYTKQFKVNEANTAKQMGSGGLDVLSTPSMIAYMENTAWEMIETDLDPEQTTVGMEIQVRHLAPTAVGETVHVKATMIHSTEKVYTLDIEAHAGDKLIGKAAHKRAVVTIEKFMKNI